MRKKGEIVKQMRKIDEVTDLPQDFAGERKEMWRQELQDIEQGRNDIMLVHQMRKIFLWLQGTVLENVATLHRTARIVETQTFSCRWLETAQLALLVSSYDSPLSCVMSHAQTSWSDFPP